MEVPSQGLVPLEYSPLYADTHAEDRSPLHYSTINSIIIVAMCSLVLFLNNGFMLIGISVFDPLMMKRLGVSVGVLKGGDTVTFATVALTAPLAGYLIDRVGPKPLFVIGMSMMAGGLVLYARADTITAIYAIHVLFGASLVLCGAFACLIVVSEATAERRGMAIGILLATASLGSAISPAAFSALSSSFGWQRALDSVAAITACTLPLVFLFVPTRLRVTAHAAHGSTQKATLASSIRSRNFWFLAIVAAVGYLCAIGLMTNMILFLSKDLHLVAADRNMVMMGLALGALLTQLAAGVLSDVVSRRVIHTVCIVAMAAGSATFSVESTALIWLALILFSVGWGGNYVMLQYLLTHLFSGPSIGRIIGVIGLIEALGASLGPILVGVSYDVVKNYSLAFEVMSVALLGTAIIASQIRKTEEPR